MREIDIHDYARQLLQAHGDKAIAEAAHRASTFEKEGKKDEAKTWRHIEAALKEMLGPQVEVSGWQRSENSCRLLRPVHAVGSIHANPILDGRTITMLGFEGP